MPVAAISLPSREHIVVDLDDTLVLTDTFAASLLEAVRRRPSCLPRLAVALFRGRAFCKRSTAILGRLDVTSLPYNRPLIEYLREQKASGSRLILATGADRSIATEVAAHLGLFDDVIGSEEGRNVIGDEKLRAIREKLGDTPFTYAGNSRDDLRVWRGSQAAIVVGASRSCMRHLRDTGIAVRREFQVSRGHWRAQLRCLRLHQWSKNILIFAPVLLAHKILDPRVMWAAFVAFMAFSLCASALYIVNDLLDLQADRVHPTKRLRPLASGEVSIAGGIGLGIVLLIAAAGFITQLPLAACGLLAGYVASSFLYSLKLKRMLFLDVVTLALLYAVRVLYGGSATAIKISVWTLAFSLFLFTSLATLKRLAELRRVAAVANRAQDYRGYKEVDINQLSSLASAGGYVAVMVLALYINSPEVVLLYRHPQVLWLLCPILIYWISRLALIANRGHLDDDPVAFALKDRATWVVGALAAVVLALST